MSITKSKYHSDLEGIAIGEHVDSEVDPRCRRAARAGMIMMTIMKYTNYTLVAYPGPSVVMSGRAEHLPLHFHVKTKEGPELRIRLEDFTEYDGLLIPKPLKLYFRETGVKQLLSENTTSVFNTGKLAK